MPEIIEYALPDSKAGQEIEKAFAAERATRDASITRAWAYYLGDHDKPLKAQQDGYDDSVIINHVAPLADDLETFLIGDGLAFDAGGDDERTGADEQIDELWRLSRGEILQSNIALAGALEGHCAVRLVPDDTTTWPKIQQVKQKHFAAFWDVFDMSRVLWYRLQSGAKRIDYVRGLVEGEVVDHEVGVWTELVYRATPGKADAFGRRELETKWELEREAVLAYDFPPIVDWQNLANPNFYYGRSDVTGAIRLNDNLNFITSNLNRIVKFYAHPRTVGTGFSADDVMSTAVGGLWTIANPEARVTNLEMQTDAALSRWLADVVTMALWQSGGMMDPQTVKDQIGALTNFGLRVLYNRAISRIGKKQRLYAEAFDEIIRRSFVLANITPPESVTIIWPDVLPEDAKQEMETLTAELDRGIISKETYRQRRGYNHEQEMDRIADESATADIGSQILGSLSFNRGQ